ncbi:MAG: thermonuclease family protein [Acidimicrobiales bacterium]
MPRLAIAFLAALVALAAGCGVGEMRSEREPAPAGRARVVRPVDGDTVVVDIDGQEEPVRFIGIDTPESVARDRPVECFGPEAKERTAELLPVGTLVRLERDVEARDRYDRLLAYVIRDEDDVFINLLLVEEGFAESIAFPPNTTRQGELDAAEGRARAEHKGLWETCGGTDVPLAPG